MRRAVVVAAVFCCVLGSVAWSADEARKSDGVRTVYLIRHGEYDSGDKSDPTVGKALVPLGVAQARLVGARLRGMPVNFTSLHCSTMTRARQTAELIGQEFPELEIQSSALISECTPPTRRKDVIEGETAEDLLACTRQLEGAFSAYLAPSPDADRSDIVVCHGNVIRYFVTKALGVDTEAWLGMSIANCSLTVITVEADGSMKVLSYSDSGHIPPNLTTRTAPGGPGNLMIPRPVQME